MKNGKNFEKNKWKRKKNDVSFEPIP